MYVSMRVTPDEKKMITKYAAAQGESVSKIMRDAFFERLEDEMDIREYKAYLKRREAGKEKFYTHEEILAEFGLDGQI
ncbi:MAG: DUF6290 family protein [Clostridiales bacterium]|nr:DUF6290 family protein [Clostridiales bacterium]